MKIGVIDIETNAITDWSKLSDLETVHCICIHDNEDNIVHRYNSQNGGIHKGLEHAAKFDILVAHNGINFDIPALNKLYGFTHPCIRDTKVMARCIYPDIKALDFQRQDFDTKLIGHHSLKSWGLRLGFPKGDFGETTDWLNWSQLMEDYCVNDVYVTHKLYHHLMSKRPSLEMLIIEHEFATLIQQQEYNGFPFDVEKAEQLTKELMIRRVELLDELQAVFPPKTEQLKSRWWVTEDGSKYSTKKDALLNGHKDVVKGDYKTKSIPFNPNSRDQIAERLLEGGWKPEAYEGKRPTINESVLKGIGTEQSEKLLEYLLISKRLGQVAEGKYAWLKCESNGRIHGKVNTNGTVSGRCSHNTPNLGQVPSTNSEYGAECRELFTAPSGKVLVGCDASGLELRCLAHYLHEWDNGEYGKKVIEEDIHTYNQNAAGLQTRAQAKTFIYAWLYGAGDAKIGSIV